MATNWQPELEDQSTEQQSGGYIYHLPPKQDESGYQVKAHIALEDSDTQTWGIAKDTEGNFTWKPGDGSIVGTWSRSPVDGLIHIFLENPLTALVDKATQRFAEFAEMRRQTSTAPKIRSKTARIPKVEVVPIPAPELDTISNLRKLFKK